MKLAELISKIVTIKLNSGEELVTKIVDVTDSHVVISEPVSVAPGPQGLGLIPSLFTSDPKAPTTLNINSIAIYSITDDQIKSKYIEATTGLVIPDKKIIMG